MSIWRFDLKYFIIIFTVFALITGCSLMESDDSRSEPVASKKRKSGQRND